MMLVIYPYKNDILILEALFVCEGGSRTTLTCQKNKKNYTRKKNYINNYFKLICFVTTLTCIYIKNYIKNCIYILKKYIYILYTKLTYFDYLNKNVEYCGGPRLKLLCWA